MIPIFLNCSLKIYIIDNGLINAVSPSFTDDLGKKLENAVYWELRRRSKEIYYYNESGFECDFVVRFDKKIDHLIHVSYDLNEDNSKREIRGLLEAMDYFELDNGIIITMNQSDEIISKNKHIYVMPAYHYFTDIQIA